MRILFVGTADFAVPILRAAAGSGHAVVGVVTQPDRPAGRRHRLRPGPVKRAASDLRLPVLQPDRIGVDDALRALDADIFLVVAYGQILPQPVLDRPRLGCYNVHASLLPALRGAAPVNWAIIRGLDRTGITIIRMDAGVDTGAIVAQRATGVGPRETAGELGERLARLGAELVLETLPLIESGQIGFAGQDERLASRAPKLTKADGAIDWTKSAVALDRFVRGVTPWPGAFTALRRAAAPDKAVRLIVCRARPAEGALQTRAGEPPVVQAEPGTVIRLDEGGLLAAAGEGALLIEIVQPAGKREMAAADFVNGYRIAAGDRFLAVGDDLS